MKQDFEAQKEVLMREVRSVLDEAETLFNKGVENGTEEAKELKARLQEKLSSAKAKMLDFEEATSCRVKHAAKQADQLVQDKPYYAMGFAALAGLVVGVLLNRR
ncbi:ElaB/YgaM/YqjD family protein [Neisseria weaveri]|uniref:Bacterial protein of uncharacterized function (DUF883) n=1 Tax=Neisseria weaveri TaxID=28091 RepID=A0A448VI16_9NEIS|nr:DUF883 family protein [Neisseria weaveri]EGV37179.1 hypothetical protein l13_04910 [Neisseria weaveri ATCC 51223]EGV37239.1 hypothetical protein l11_13420 [Neisseria weaveri LMG 5135]SAY50991.1 Bacterial protein of uncharacterised function (DUF883) [Neisseria weaveri]VEJ49419.1 Bacterial protein of uncharacterised function (DUF883) [Neisseria weaveri]